MSIVDILNKIMNDVPVVPKTERASMGGTSFNFRGIDAVLTAVGPALRRHGVVVAPTLQDCVTETVATANGRPMNRARVTVAYTFYGPGPEREALVAVVPGEAMDAGDKAVSKAMSVAFRTALIQMLSLPTDEPDPDTFIHEAVSIDPAAALVDEIGRVASERGLVEAVVTRWAELHDGEDIRKATDVEALKHLLARLQAVTQAES